MNDVVLPALRTLAERRRGALLLLCLSLCTSACVSVPLSTIARMSTFDTQDFAQLDPEVIRVRIKLPDGFGLDAGRSSLGARITSSAGVHEGEFRLEQIAVERARLSQGLFAGEAWGTVYSLRLSARSRKEFGDLQAFVRKGKPEDMLISVKPILSAFPNDASEVDVWIDLLLSQGQGYFTLLDAAQVPLDAIRKASAAN